MKRVLGDATNLFMAAAAFNFRKWMRRMAKLLLSFGLACLLGPHQTEMRFSGPTSVASLKRMNMFFKEKNN